MDVPVPYGYATTAIKKESPNEGTETCIQTGTEQPDSSSIKKESPNEGTETGVKRQC